MPRQDCSRSCDVPRTRRVSILGTPVMIRAYRCARDGGAYFATPERPKLQLTIIPTKLCNAHCPFCIAAPTGSPKRLDPALLRKTLEALRQEDVIRGISISGGEPSLDMVFLDEVIRCVFDVLGAGVQVTLDTNGTGIGSLKRLRDLYRLDAVHVSRHHWDDTVNDSVFGRKMPTADMLRKAFQDIGFPELIVMNCLMLRKIVDTPEDASRYMDFAISLGAGKVSFITADPVNAWTAEHGVLFDDVLRDDDDSLLFTREYRDYDRCRCRDGVYVSSRGKLIEFYGRQTTTSGCDYCCGMVYGPDNVLRTGFGENDPVLHAERR